LLIHEHFEELGTLTVTGQASQAQFEELKEHMQTCAECREMVGDFVQIADGLFEVAEKRPWLQESEPEGMTDRFIARAHSEGVPLSRGTKSEIVARWRVPSGVAIAAFAAALIGSAALGVTTVKRFMLHPAIQMSVGPNVNHDLPTVALPGADLANEHLRYENTELKKQLQDVRTEMAALAAKLRSGQDAQRDADSAKSAMMVRLQDLEKSNAELHKGVGERESEVAQLKSELERAQSGKEADTIALQVEEAELRNLREKVVELDSKLHESEQLSAAARQASDLIVARKLHIIDVHDADEDGQRKRAFGRIFYTEGKSLVFYAYDLADPRGPNLKASFHVWGANDDTSRAVKSLGIFRADDETEGRWILTVDDPHVLGQINTVFVTIETRKKAVTLPNGKKILYAFLGNKANHP
jgi:hypothetical protein